MAVPIVPANVTIRNLHLSPNVIGSGLDPNYCPGANGYERLANLRDLANKGSTRAFYMGKFRNYQRPSIHYRLGFLYNGKAIYSNYNSTTPVIAIPDGWRLPNEYDWLDIIQAIEPNNNFSNNTILPHLRCVYTHDQLYPLIGNPNPSWPNEVTKYDTYNLKVLAAGHGCTSAEKVTWFSVGSFYRTWLQGISGNTYRAIVYNISNNRLSLDTNPGNIPTNDANDPAGAYHGIRLVKNDSINPGFVEDSEGNVYKTVKIGNTVIMAEGLRSTKDRFGNNLFKVTLGATNPNINSPCYIDTTQLDIP